MTAALSRGLQEKSQMSGRFGLLLIINLRWFLPTRPTSAKNTGDVILSNRCSPRRDGFWGSSNVAVFLRGVQRILLPRRSIRGWKTLGLLRVLQFSLLLGQNWRGIGPADSSVLQKPCSWGSATRSSEWLLLRSRRALFFPIWQRFTGRTMEPAANADGSRGPRWIGLGRGRCIPSLPKVWDAAVKKRRMRLVLGNRLTGNNESAQGDARRASAQGGFRKDLADFPDGSRGLRFRDGRRRRSFRSAFMRRVSVGMASGRDSTAFSGAALPAYRARRDRPLPGRLRAIGKAVNASLFHAAGVRATARAFPLLILRSGLFRGSVTAGLCSGLHCLRRAP